VKRREKRESQRGPFEFPGKARTMTVNKRMTISAVRNRALMRGEIGRDLRRNIS
jgi:hypothetical protein